MSFEDNPADDDPHGECRNEIHSLQGKVADLLAACEAVMPWVVLATANGDPHRHPQSIENAKSDLALLKAAIQKARGTP